MKKLAQTGELNQRISIIKKGEGVQGDFGWEEGKPITVVSCWAKVRRKYMKEKLAAIGTIYEDTETFIIRYRQDAEIKTEHQLMHDDVLYEITSIEPDISTKEFITIVAKKVGD